MIEPIKITIDMTDAEQRAAESVANIARAAQDALDRGFKSAVDKTIQKLDELKRKQDEVSKVLESDKKRITELEQQKEQASGNEKRRIEQELDNLKRLANGREQELLKLAEKEIKLREVQQLATASSEAEREGIRKATDARLSEIGAMRDQTRAQSGITDEVEKSGEAMSSLISKFAAFITFQQGLEAIKGVVAGVREEIDKSVEAQAKLQAMQQGIWGQERGVFLSMGLHTEAQQKEAREVIQNVQRDYNLQRQDVTGAMTGVGAYFKQAGIDYKSDAGQKFIGESGMLHREGLSGENLGQLFQQQMAASGGKMSPAEFAQQGANIMQAAGGNAQWANQMLGGWFGNKDRYEQGGMDFTRYMQDQTALYAKGGAGYAERGSRQMSTALDRVGNMRPDQLAAMYERLNPARRGMDAAIAHKISTIQDPLQRMRAWQQARDPNQAMTPLDSVFEGAIQKGMTDKNYRPGRNFVDQVISAEGQMTPAQAAIANEQVFGTRGASIFGEIGNTSNVQLPTGQPMSRIQTGEYSATVQEQLAEGDSKAFTIPSEAGWRKRMDLTAAELERTPDLLPISQRGAFRGVTQNITQGLGLTDTAKEYTAMWLLTSQYMKLAEQAQTETDPEKRKPLARQMQNIRKAMNPDDAGKPTAPLISKDDLGKLDDPRVMSKYVNDLYQNYGNISEAAGGEHADWYHNPRIVAEGGYLYDATAGNLRQRQRRLPPTVAAPATPPAATQPTSRPSAGPVSINNNYNVIYGYGYDSIGSPSEAANTFG